MDQQLDINEVSKVIASELVKFKGIAYAVPSIDILEGKKFRGIFIRAPVIDALYDGCKILAEHENKPILVEQNNLLVSTFHPELTNDKRIH